MARADCAPVSSLNRNSGCYDLIGWGYCGMGTFFWETSGEPDEWKVVASEVRGPAGFSSTVVWLSSW